jgi:carboxypeptidase C (cathepsin A)
MPKRSSLALIAALVILPPTADAAAPEPQPMSKHHTAVIDGKRFGYTAIFDRFEVASAGGKVGGTVTTISYVRDGADAHRPVVFAFNGGPGAASLPLNVGMLGPRRVDLPTNPADEVPTHVAMVPNDDSILDRADIVLMDPVGSGFSKLLDRSARPYFQSVLGDAQSFADAIEAWTRNHGRQSAPKYILGESYGAVRAVELAIDLAKTPDAANVYGVVVISQSLQIIDTVQRRSNIVGQVAGMPTLAATAWYHKLAGREQSLADFVREASAFAKSDWLPALFAGTQLPDAARRRVADRLSHYTGVSASYLLQHDLYLTKETYRRVALSDRGLMLGLYDTRYTGPLEANGDPARKLSVAIGGAYEDMFRDEFEFAAPDYDRAPTPEEEQIGDDIWIYTPHPLVPTDGDTYLQIDYIADLLRLMTEQPRLRLLVAGGWYDTAASAGADDYLMSRPGLDLRRVTAQHYIGGHMFYTVPESRAAFARALRNFVSQGR